MNAMLMLLTAPTLSEMFEDLMACRRGYANDAFFARILAAQRGGQTCLPIKLGLSDSEFEAFIKCYFPTIPVEILEADDADDEGSDLRQELLAMRYDEWRDVRNLLMHGRANSEPSTLWMANIVAAACMGGGHLWRDLGMSTRAELRQLLIQHFPLVAMRNIKDMKWKKFFYKELCEQAGSYVCRSPSCEQCTGYDECFGPET